MSNRVQIGNRNPDGTWICLCGLTKSQHTLVCLSCNSGIKAAPRMMTKALRDEVIKLLKVQAFLGVVREQVDAIERRILSETDYQYDPKYGRTGPLTDPALTYLICKDQWDEYFGKRQSEVVKLGYPIPLDHCPRCVAENREREIKQRIAGIGARALDGMNLERLLRNGTLLDEFVVLSVKMVINAPGFVAPTIGDEVIELVFGRASADVASDSGE